MVRRRWITTQHQNWQTADRPAGRAAPRPGLLRLGFVRLQRYDLALHGVLDLETVAARDGRPPRVAALAFGRGQFVVVDGLVAGEQHPLGAPRREERRAGDDHARSGRPR